MKDVAKEETKRVVEEAKQKERAQSLIQQELKQEKTKLEDTIYRLKRLLVAKESHDHYCVYIIVQVQYKKLL